MRKNTLKAEVREGTGKSVARAIRKQGRVPAIVYGGNGKDVPISIDKRELVQLYTRGRFKSRVIELDLGSEKINVLPRALDLHPLKLNTPIHVDFERLDPKSTRRVKVTVPLNFINGENSPGMKRGGVLNAVRHSVELLCPVDKIPTSLDVDLSGLQIKDSVHFSKIETEEGVEPTISDRDFTVATIVGRIKKEEVVVATVEGEEGEEGAEGAEGETAEGAEGAEGGEAPAEGGEEAAAE